MLGGGPFHTHVDARRHNVDARRHNGAGDEAGGARGIAVCGYLSDVEGNLDYFERYVARSEISTGPTFMITIY